MSYHARLRAFFKSKGLKNRSIAQTLGYGDQMMSKYLNSSPPNLEFLSRLARHYPDLDLNLLFRESLPVPDVVSEPDAAYNKANEELILIEEIEDKLNTLKKKIRKR